MTAGDSLSQALLVGAFAVPWVLVAAMAVPRLRPGSITLAPLGALPALALALFAEPGTALELPGLLEHAVLVLDDPGRIFLGFTSVLYSVAAWYARNYLRGDPVRVRFFVLLLLCMAGNIGLVIAGDVPTFFTSYAVMGLASAGLVSHRIDDDTRRASRVYLSLTMIGEVVVLTGLSFLVVRQGTSEIASLHQVEPDALALALVLVGFGIKAGALTLHFWLPLAHPAAPIPASAVLSGAMIKAGLLGWIRFLPLGEAAMPTLGAVFMTAGLAAAILGAAVGVLQRNPKTILAYSSVCQMGILMTGLGIGAVRPDAWPGILAAVLVYTAHHALAKGALFLGVGPALGARTRTQIAAVRAGMLVPALALAGAPLTSGAIAKTALKSNLVLLPEGWAWAVGVLLPLGAVGTTALMIRLLTLVWPPRDDAEEHPTAGLWAPWLSLVAAVVVGVWLLPGSLEWLRLKLTPAKIWLAVWPLLAGGALAVLGAWIQKRWKVDPSRWVPPGDVGVLAGRLVTRLVGAERPSPPAAHGHAGADGAEPGRSRAAELAALLGRGLAVVERTLARWPVAGLALLAVLACLLALLAR